MSICTPNMFIKCFQYRGGRPRNAIKSESHIFPKSMGTAGTSLVLFLSQGTIKIQDSKLKSLTLSRGRTVISLCALEAFSLSSPAQATWQEYWSCWAGSALERPHPDGGC